MRFSLLPFLLLTAICGMLAALPPGLAEPGASGADPAPARKAATRGLQFLQKDDTQWKAERKCASCHHGTMTLWAFGDAKQQGYPVDAGFLADLARWTKERLEGIEKPRDPRPGWNMISTPALYLAVMAQNQPGQKTMSAGELKQIRDHVACHLEDDGSVLTPATMSPPMPQNGPPPVFESREVLTLFALLAMTPGTPDPDEPAAVRDARKKAASWLAGISPGQDTQAMALRLLLAAREHKPAAARDAAMTDLLRAQHADGGWGQLRNLPSDAYATGQALYFLSLAGADGHGPEIQSGTAFLVANQREDGSWPMTSRAHPGATPFTNPAPITHFGSCWAVLSLARSVAGG